MPTKTVDLNQHMLSAQLNKIVVQAKDSKQCLEDHDDERKHDFGVPVIVEVAVVVASQEWCALHFQVHKSGACHEICTSRLTKSSVCHDFSALSGFECGALPHEVCTSRFTTLVLELAHSWNRMSGRFASSPRGAGLGVAVQGDGTAGEHGNETTVCSPLKDGDQEVGYRHSR